MLELALAFWADESGISAVEYTMLLAIVAGGIIVAVGQLGGAVEGEITDAANCIDTLVC